MQSWERYSPGEIIGGRYELRQVYQGGMGIVFLCNDLEEKIPFALKSFQDAYLATPEAKERFVKEATAWIQLGYHNYVVHAERIRIIDGKPYLVLECVLGSDGASMSMERKLASGPLSLQEAIRYAMQLCLGLTYVQSVAPGLVHRDIKPSNILISHEDFAKITDFGIFTLLKEDAQKSSGFFKSIFNRQNDKSGILGTYAYMSPEQAQGRNVDTRSDIYATGLLLFEMLTAECYREVVENSQGADRFFGRIRVNSGPEIVAIIQKCLADEPSKRYKSFVDLGQELDRVYQLNFYEPILFEHRIQLVPGLWHIVKDLSFRDVVHWITGKEKSGNAVSRELNEQNYVLLYSQAVSLHEIGQYQMALEKFEKVLDIFTEWTMTDNFPQEEINEGISRILVNKANALQKLHRKREAIETYEEALKYDDEHYNTWYNLAELRFNEMHDLQGALEAYQISLLLNWDDYMAWNSIGFVHSELGDFQEAIKCYARALELNPRFTTALGNMGSLLLNAGKASDAKECFQKITKIDPGNALGWYYLASIIFETDQSKAREYYRMAQSLEPRFGDDQLLWQVNQNRAARSK